MRNNADVVTPHSLEGEKAILGAVLIDGKRFLDIADRIAPDDFFRDAHRLIFRTMLDLATAGQQIDWLTIAERLKQSGQLEAVGGRAYIASLTDGIPSSTHIEHYAAIVKDLADKKRLISAARKILADTQTSDEDARALIDRAERAIFAVAQHDTRGDFIDAETLAAEGMAAIQTILDNQKGATGIPTGFTDFDDMTRGLHPGSLVLLAARPSMGKTALALSVSHYAASQGHHVGLFSLEMSRQEVFLRLVSSLGSVDGHRLQSGRLAAADHGRIGAAVGVIASSNLHVDDTPVLGVLDVRGKARRLKAKHGLGLVVLDYLQLMQLEKAENRNVAVAEASRALKLLARELHVPVLALSQLSRESERRSEKKPMLSDLRDSGALEQDADVVMFIHRAEVYDANDRNAGLAELIIAKQRNGRTGTVKLAWLKEFARFHNYTEERR